MDITVSVLLILGYLVGLVVLYKLIKSAVRSALGQHYKTVRWFEATGTWNPDLHDRTAPRELPTQKIHGTA